jgi:hypothetical protein
MKTKIEIINETVKYYSQDVNRRAYDPRYGCVYLTSTGKMCAVGRCLINPSKGFIGSVSSFSRADNTPVDLETELKPEYRGHGLQFWNVVQALHDNSYYWCNTGLTSAGTAFYKSHLKKYAKQ